jgi:transposase-like protein
MAQHFLLSSAAHDLSLDELYSMSPEDQLRLLARARWGSETEQACPRCSVFRSHRFKPKRQRWRCRDCDHEFTIKSGTVFHASKLPLRKLLSAVWFFTRTANSTSAIELSFHIGVKVVTAWLLWHKLREVVTRTMSREPMTGVIEADGGYFGGKPRRPRVRQKSTPAAIQAVVASGRLNGAAKARNHGISPLNAKKKKNRRSVISLRQRSNIRGAGAVRTHVSVALTENSLYIEPVVRRMVSPGSLLVTDEGGGFSTLGAHFDHEVVPHSVCYATSEGVNQNQAESFNARLRRIERTHHGVRPKHLASLAVQGARLEDCRRMTARTSFLFLLSDCFLVKHSMWWRGWFQKLRRQREVLMDQFDSRDILKRQCPS